MPIFEFHFNPLKREERSLSGKGDLNTDLIFESFYYEPKNIYERKMGGLYMVGTLRNVLPKNLYLLKNIAKLIKEEYYKKAIFTPERSLKETLKRANDYLEEMAKRGDVSWLGNLGFVILALTPQRKIRRGFKLNFTKVGEMKILLMRTGKIIDVDKKLKFRDIEPYPLKVFGNIVSGRLAENDLVMVFTKDIFAFFQKTSLMEEISKQAYLSETWLKNALNSKRDELGNTSGIFLAISLIKETAPFSGERVSKREIFLPKPSREFSLKEILMPFLEALKKLEKPKIALLPRQKIREIASNKKLVLVLSFLFILLLGFIVFRLF